MRAQVLDPQLLAILLVVAVAAILVQSWRLSRARQNAEANLAAADREVERGVAARARGARAAEGEAGAVALLEGAGYEVRGRQVAGSWTVRADDERVTFGLRADYLVARGGKAYIAEVKTGRLAPRLAHGPTRRQLLEYGAAFDVDGVLLVDADAGVITHVEMDLFADGARRGHRGYTSGALVLVALICLAIGAIGGLALGR